MPGLIGDIYRASVLGWADGEMVVNTLSFRLTAEKTPSEMAGELATLAGHVKAVWELGLAPLAHEDVLYEGITIAKVFGAGDPFVYEATWNLQGEQTSVEMLPTLVALPFVLRTGLGGRSNRGRFHWGPILEEYQDGGRLNAAGLTARGIIITRLEALRNLTFTSFTWVVHSRKRSWELLAENPLSWTSVAHLANRAVTAVEATAVLGSMYSRKIGRGA